MDGGSMSRPLTDRDLVRGIGLLATTAIVIGGVIGTGVFLKANAGGQAALATGCAIFLNALTNGALGVDYFRTDLAGTLGPSAEYRQSPLARSPWCG
jgi:hypothetical protein